MRFLILGSGGIGSYYGARLQAAGHDVVFVARGEHLAALQQSGLQVGHPDFRFDGSVSAVDTNTLQSRYVCGDFDCIVLTLKAGATASIMNDLRDWLQSSDTPVLSLQNGVDNEQSIENVVGRERTIGGLAVRIGAHVVEPGRIEATGPAQVVMGGWPNESANSALHSRLSALAEVFNQANIPATVTAQIQYELWRKLLINNGVNPLSALTGLDTRALTSHPVFSRSVYQLMQEAARAAVADGIRLSQQDVDEMFELISRFDAIKTSMLVDREQGRPLELDDICGAVAMRCRSADEPAMLTELVMALLEQQIGTPVQA